MTGVVNIAAAAIGITTCKSTARSAAHPALRIVPGVWTAAVCGWIVDAVLTSAFTTAGAADMTAGIVATTIVTAGGTEMTTSAGRRAVTGTVGDGIVAVLA